MRVLILSVVFGLTVAAFVMGADTRSSAEPDVGLPVLDLSRTAGKCLGQRFSFQNRIHIPRVHLSRYASTRTDIRCSE